MKKLVFIVAAMFCLSFGAQAQGIKLGLKAGANLSNFAGEDAEDSKNKFGFHVGGFLDYGISDMVSIRPEVLYSMKGAAGESEGDDNSSINLNYIDVPVLARINADNLFFEFGPTVSFLVQSEAEMGSLSVDFKDYTKSVDFGYAAGLGYQFGSIGLGLRYNGGLSTIFKGDNENPELSDAKIRNSVFQLSLSYTLGGR